MAYWIQEAGSKNRPLYRTFICDYRTDVENLPTSDSKGVAQEGDSTANAICSYGSDALVLEDASVWILGKDTNEWIEI